MAKPKTTEKQAWKTPGKARQHILELRQKNTCSAFMLVDSIVQLRKLGQNPEPFLRAQGVSPNEYLILEKILKLLFRHRAALEDRRTDFETLTVLVEVGMRSRAMALRQVSKGIAIDAATVRSYETQLRERRMSGVGRVRERLQIAVLHKARETDLPLRISSRMD
ncbi:hypothetical protein Rleg4DRAFT_2470 [Rhizobium leguminosarum bv. trifolii WSM2297]|uniref:Uncharacterized protein n=1 Tax=Rhizobium leguminosarum bv. trifolii WSM2297 TaxID=754762 RepID=J0W6M6_RHILT|nr:hypothetical protein [Rhizobium leguminosarum]EJC80808.1 hypothetical protein Rleg4DRAFT_2470 [Rhizobium leguminosarum bv. trifolii WSM2297]